MPDKTNSSVDGFVARRSLGGRQDVPVESGLRPAFDSSGLTHATDERELKGSALSPQQQGGLTREHIDRSLSEIEEEDEHAKKQRRRHINKRKFIKRFLIALIALFVIGGIVLGVKFLLASGNIFKGNVLGFVQSKELKMDANGRSNIVVFGTSEDDEGGDHPGAFLTDSILIVSIDQKNNNAYSYSIPRDLWVDYGRSCVAGTEGRINVVFQCYSEDGKDEEAGALALKKVLSTVTGSEIHYYAHVNYSVVRDTVDAVGGVEVTIDSNDPRGILDRNFDWKCNYQCYFVKYPNGPTGVMDGEHALALARARGASGNTYGLERGNFDREIHQQKIGKALIAKALSAGTLTNFGKVSNLIDAFGKNLRTNFETGEIRTLMQLAQDIPSGDIQSISLIDAEPAIFTTDNLYGQSIVRPVAGLKDYSEIAQYLRQQMSSDPVVREKPVLGVFNGSGVAGSAQSTADKLIAGGLSVPVVGNAPGTNYPAYTVYDLTAGKKPKTAEKLATLYGVEIRATAPPFATTGLDFVIIVGPQPAAN